jgi:hypothetical protein
MLDRFSVILVIVCTIILFNGVTNIAMGADWVPYASDSTDNEYFYDKSSIRAVSKEVIKVWSKRVYSNNGRTKFIQNYIDLGLPTNEYKFLQETKNLFYFNCNESKYKLTAAIHNSIDGNVLDSLQNDSQPWREVAPESITESLLKAVCPKKK